MTQAVEHEHTQQRDPDLWSNDVEWLLRCACAALGERSNMSSVMASLESGGAHGQANTDPYTDQQVGWGAHATTGTVARARTLRAIWVRVPREHMRVLVVHYTTRSQWPQGVVTTFGVFAGVAMYVAPERVAAVMKACEQVYSAGPTKRRRLQALIDAQQKRAERAVRKAHRAFREAKRLHVVAG